MHQSESFGRIFWVDEDFEFRSCPQYLDGTGDFDNSDYVSEWDDWEGVDLQKLFAIHKSCVINKVEHANSLTFKEAL